MSDLFQDRSCMHWWLPNEEGYPHIIRAIRKLVEERTSPANNMPAKDIKDMKAIFSNLRLDDGKSSVSPEKNTSNIVAVAPSHDSYISQGNMQEIGDVNLGDGVRDAYGIVFDDG